MFAFYFCTQTNVKDKMLYFKDNNLKKKRFQKVKLGAANQSGMSVDSS